MRWHRPPRIHRTVCALGALILCSGLAAYGEETAFAASINDTTREATVSTIERGGKSYISLTTLLQQLGGACTVESGRLQADLAEQSAWLAPDSCEVQSSLDNFLLKNPVIQEGADVLVAFEEIDSLLARAFGVKLTRTAANPAGQMTEPPKEPPVVLEALTPLEPVAPAPDAKAEAPRDADRNVQVIIIDPGHGGKDAGCQGPTGAKEADIVLAIAGRLQKLLEQGSPRKCILTRDKDRPLGRAERVAFANSNKGDLLISIHTGGAPDPEPHGFQIFCCSPKPQPSSGEKVETGVGTEYVDRSMAFGGIVGNKLQESSGAENRGVWRAPCHVLKDIAMPGILVETGFLTNPNEEGLLVTDAYQQKIAEGIAEGVKAYIAGAANQGAAQ